MSDPTHSPVGARAAPSSLDDLPFFFDPRHSDVVSRARQAIRDVATLEAREITATERDRDLILSGNVERILADHRVPETSTTRGA